VKKTARGKKKAKLVLFARIIVVVAVAALLLFHLGSPLGIRALFPDGFFDFNQFTVTDDNAKDLDSIIAKYEPVFTALQNTALERLEELYQAAVAEYREESTAGTYNRFRLTTKYLQAGRLLESSVNDAFYKLLNAMEKELISNNLPVTIVTELDDAYKQAKQEKKEELFGRLREQLGR